MPVELKYRGDHGVVFACSGVVEAGEIRAVDASLNADTATLCRIPYQIVDLSAATDFRLSSADMRDLARSDAAALGLNSAMRIAIVAPDPLSYGMNRVYLAHLRTHQDRVRIFTDADEAFRWVGADSETLPDGVA